MLSAVHWLVRSKSKETVFPDGGRERGRDRHRGAGTENENTNSAETESERTSLG